MANFTPVSAAIGGALIGLSAVLLMLSTGRIAGIIGYGMVQPKLPSNWAVIIAAGLLVGFGTRLGGGCTSGHGICGIARLSPRSIAATIVFMVTAIITVAVTHHLLGG